MSELRVLEIIVGVLALFTVVISCLQDKVNEALIDCVDSLKTIVARDSQRTSTQSVAEKEEMK